MESSVSVALWSPQSCRVPPARLVGGAAPAWASSSFLCLAQAARWHQPYARGLSSAPSQQLLQERLPQRGCVLPPWLQREPKAGLVRGGLGALPRTPLSLGSINVLTAAPRGDVTGNGLAFARACVRPGRARNVGLRIVPDSPLVRTGDAITERSSRQGSQSCDSTAQLEMKSNHRL